MFTISIPQSIGEGLKKRVPVNVVGKKFKVIKNVHNVDGSIFSHIILDLIS